MGPMPIGTVSAKQVGMLLADQDTGAHTESQFLAPRPPVGVRPCGLPTADSKSQVLKCSSGVSGYDQHTRKPKFFDSAPAPVTKNDQRTGRLPENLSSNT